MSHEKKNRILSSESWLVNDGILISWIFLLKYLYNWVVFHPHEKKNSNQPGFCFFRGSPGYKVSLENQLDINQVKSWGP